jgi:ATP-dependent Clp protease protease subunit
MSFHTGQAVEQIEKDVERDRIMTADQAKEYGIIDQVIKHRE